MKHEIISAIGYALTATVISLAIIAAVVAYGLATGV